MNWRYLVGTTPDERLALSEAYTRVFRTGGATDVDREVVLNDILVFAGYFAITTNREDLAFNEGKRSVAGLIFSMMNMPDAEREALYQASRQSNLEGQRYG
jgi:hypothetical protein